MFYANKLKAPTAKPNLNQLRVGTYKSKVMKVLDHPDYRDGDAVKIIMKLEDQNGNLFDYEETFIIRGNNNRTEQMGNYLAENGIEYWDDFVGCCEEVVLRKAARNFKIFLTIDERRFLSGPEVGVDSEAEC